MTGTGAKSGKKVPAQNLVLSFFTFPFFLSSLPSKSLLCPGEGSLSQIKLWSLGNTGHCQSGTGQSSGDNGFFVNSV